MKKMKYLIFAGMLAFTGCADDGDPGPKGDKGDTGEQGAQGQQGQQGEPGTANVSYSEWMRFDWNVSDEEYYKAMEIDEPAITDAFLNEGGMLISFLKLSTAEHTQMTQLPMSNTNESLILAAITLADITPPFTIQNGVIVVLSSLNGNPIYDYESGNGGGYSFRYILIPGGTPLSSAGRLAQPVDFSDYEAVKAYYDIPD